MTAYIIAACRSAVVPRGGAFAQLSIDALGAPVLGAALGHAGISPDQVDEVIVSNAIGGGGNPARLVALAADLPERVAGLSIDRQCAGGLDAVLLATAMIESGVADIVVAGGVESYSRRPQRSRTFADGRPPEPFDQPPFTPWPARDPDMAQAAETIAAAHNISKDAQDAWAIQSHEKARTQTISQNEMVILEHQTTDPFTRRLSPALAARAKTVSGTITTANMAVAADAAAFCVVVSERMMRQLGCDGIAILGGATRGGTPEQPALAPISSTKAALEQTKTKVRDMTTSEVMEAFAVQAIACVKGAMLDPETVNRGGGALARGHPIGASGTINAVRLFHELRQRGGTGLATIAAAGGIATTLVLRA